MARRRTRGSTSGSVPQNTAKQHGSADFTFRRDQSPVAGNRVRQAIRATGAGAGDTGEPMIGGAFRKRKAVAAAAPLLQSTFPSPGGRVGYDRRGRGRARPPQTSPQRPFVSTRQYATAPLAAMAR